AAAERLMTANPIDSVTIKDITEAADVGQGSFYLHFKSKYEVLIPIIQLKAEMLDKSVQLVTKSMDDPAEILSVSMRYIARTLARDELWRWFLQHSGMPVSTMESVFGEFSRRDLMRGFDAGRFNVADIRVAATYGFGGYVNSIVMAFENEDPDSFIDNAIESMLRVLGLSQDEAHVISHGNLPPLPPYP
ncbi:MAG: TetR/AcrR family transcriptional regulator, partial [Gammaproteobacteria bacterium]|nr:TetR/AcrR family transcriptional regulator [Gammaproteobacteria bacterium]